MEFDYIVVGAGSAGCVVATRLVEAGYSVQLLEAGPRDHALDYRLHMPAALSHVLANDAYNWFYNSAPEPYLDQRSLYCPRGRTLGGSSSINGMIYVRGNPGDFDRWASLSGFPQWSYEQCLPYFKQAETATHGEDAYRGRQGPLQVTRGEMNNPLFDVFLSATEQAGHAVREDLNGAEQEGFGTFDRTIYQGQRFSAARAYLSRVKGHPGLTTETRCQVLELETSQNRVTGVHYLQGRFGRKQLTSRARREVIVCAGAINSPKLLMLSGIGDSGSLSQLDIPVVQHLPGVGQNLQDHLEVYVQQACTQPVSIYPHLKWYNQIPIGINWYLFKRGPGATNHFEAGGFIRSEASRPFPDIQYHFLPVAMRYDGAASAGTHGYQAHVGPMKPTSRGAVTLASADPLEAPHIQFNYAETETDRQVMRAAIRSARDIFSQNAFDEFRGAELAPGSEVQSDAEIDAFVRAHGESAYHPSCTCKMGQDEMAVVDGEGRVYGMDNLRVIDASIMPEITNGNLNAPTIMLAEKLVAGIIGEQGG